MVDNVNPNGSNSGLTLNLLPAFYRTEANKKFLQATLDQLYQPGSIKKTNGYIGRENAKSSTGSDIFVEASDSTRQNYQLEPALTVTDSIGNVTFFKDYIDYINQLNVFGANTSNHARLNKQEFYSWDPHIDWDKFVNFQNYYWLPYGPDLITIYGQQLAIESTYTVTLESELNNNQYLFTPNGFTRNPVLRLFRGQTYTFEINSPGNPFSFKTARSLGIADRYEIPTLSDHAVTNGTITFTIPSDAPSLLYYQSESDLNLGGVIAIYNITEDTFINVTDEILGKKQYKLANGTQLSNGMKLAFGGNVSPDMYMSGKYYVDGVGTSIRLIPETILEITSPYTTVTDILFDSDAFDTEPFDNASGFANTLDYIVINRASRDYNPWSRYNRWFHKDVINASSAFNNAIANLDQKYRAIRPIIEFNADLKLFNYGTVALDDIDLVDDFTTDVFSTIEGTFGYNIDSTALQEGHRILFTADTDILVKNKIFEVRFIDIQHINGVKQIHLVEIIEPTENHVVLVRQGKINQGQSYWFNGTAWKLAQKKTVTNQPPLFDIVDSNKISYGNTEVYNGSTFTGTSIFSYKKGKGVTDPSLGFPLAYQNVSNIGDIVFNFNLATDAFEYKKTTAIISQKINVGYLVTQDYAGNVVYENGWKRSVVNTLQAAVRLYKNSNKTNNFNLDIFDDVNNLEDLVVQVFVNGKRLDWPQWSIKSESDYKQIVLKTDISLTDVLTLKAYAAQPINSKGYYEIPISLQNNPLNDEINEFTLGEVIDHVNSIVDNLGKIFVGVFPGESNLRDLGNLSEFGTKFVQHSGPSSLSLYHITSPQNNIVQALELSRDEYSNFKRNLIAVAESLGVDADSRTLVDIILLQITKDTPKTHPYYFSDMLPFGASLITNLNVVDYRIKLYPLTNSFNLEKLSPSAVGVYLNNTQLIHGRDYTFVSQNFINVSAPLVNGDIITTYEYESTDACFVPETPTKLGIWPKYEPKLYLDTSYVTPRWMIQGHDGSQVLAYGTYGDSGHSDYRDGILLEFEKRIYNNIKINYDISICDFAKIIPSYNRTNDYSIDEFNKVLAPSFYKWTGLVGVDFTKPLSYDRSNSFTYNYAGHSSPDGRNVPGYWRGIYRWMLDTDRPNLCPWEMLGFSIEPKWWTTLYGPSPYTNDNRPMWQDIADGMVREPGKPAVYLSDYAKPFLMDHIPVDENGNIVSPAISGLASGVFTVSTDNNFVFGDVSPVESAWRRSSHYPFSVVLASILLTPAQSFGALLDRSRIVRNIAGQLINSDTGLRIRPADVVLPSIYSSTTRVQTAGIINYIVDYILHFTFSNNLKSYNMYRTELKTLLPKLSYRVGSFTNKEQFNLLLDSKTPLSAGSVFIPKEDYDIILNTSSTVRKITYSGVIITKLQTGFEVKGYSITQPYFKYYRYIKTGAKINIGGISETYSTWTAYQQYGAGTNVRYNNVYYRVQSTHTAAATFNPAYYQALPDLPIVGGANAALRSVWDRTESIDVPYGTLFSSIQDVVDFLLGYGEWLKDQGFIFDEFNAKLGTVSNWESSAKEFLFWTTQNWSASTTKWQDWTPTISVPYGNIIRYNGDYYSALFNVPPSEIFDTNLYTKLAGLSDIGSSVLSVSPSASKLVFNAPLTVVEDINNPFNGYEIFKVDGTPLSSIFLDSYRNGNLVSYTTKTTDGIYCASFYLVQLEHVAILNNNTIFNDTLYNPGTGYRQERIKLAGYITSGWYGGLDIPGFIFDQAKIQEWEPWKDYALGDTVSYQSFYYSATAFIAGALVFKASLWTKLTEKPTPKLLPNWTNIATQFTDFYSLDDDNFSSTQQKVAHHLIGYQKRRYLGNIIKDDVSEFKFYQGMVREKGTLNVLKKLFDVLSSENKESLVFYEEWALRVGQYGASNSFENIEFVLDEALFRNNPQGYLLLNQQDPTLNVFINQQTPNSVYLKPLNYNSSPWPALPTYNQYFRDAGYVDSADVFLTLGSLSDITSQDITTFSNGAYIWVTFEKNSWNVYRYTDINLVVTNVTYDKTLKILTITAQDIVNLKVGSYIGLAQISILQGFYKIETVTLNSFTVSANITGFPVPTFTQSAELVVYALKSQRVDSIDSIDTALPNVINNGELVWTDKNFNDLWTVWKYGTVYQQSLINNFNPQDNLEYGLTVAMNKAGNISAVGTAIGQIITYDKASPKSPWIQRQVILPPFIARANLNLISDIARVVGFSPDGSYMAIGSPFAGSASHNFVGAWVSGTIYGPNLIVSIDPLSNGNIQFYKAMAITSDSPLNSYKWKRIPYITVSQAGSWSQYDSYPVGALVTYNDVQYRAILPTFGNTTVIITAIDGFTGRLTTTSTASLEPGRLLKFESTGAFGGIIPTQNYYVLSIDNSTQFTITDTYNGTNFVLLTSGKGRMTVTQEAPSAPSAGVSSWTRVKDQIGPSAHGVVSLYSKDTNNIYTLVDTIISPNITANEQFGSTITFGNNNLFIGAVGNNNNTGAVYGLVYTEFLEATTGYNPVGSSFSTIVVSSTVGIREGMYVRGIGFTGDQQVEAVINSVTLVLTGSPNSTPSGTLNFISIGWRYQPVLPITGTVAGSNFGSSIAVSGDNSVLAIAAAGGTVGGSVTVFFNINEVAGSQQLISNSDINFGQSISLSDSSEYLIISDDSASKILRPQIGNVYIYKFNGINYGTTPYQTLVDHHPEPNGRFGNKVSFMNDYKTIVVYSLYGDTANAMTFNTGGVTTFDKNSTTFSTKNSDSGRIDIYDNYFTKWVFSESLATTNQSSDGFGTGFAVGNDHVFVSAPNAVDYDNLQQPYISGRVYYYGKQPNTHTWETYKQEIEKPNISRVKKAFLYNRTTNQLIRYLDVVDPAQGKIPGPAEEEIKFKTFYDPAHYSVGDDRVNIDARSAWSKDQVGTLWWDLRTAKFIDSYSSDVVYRNSTWNSLAIGASIDIYEWVSTTNLPSAWDKIADTGAGVALGISGKSLYGDSCYSTRQVYDNVSKKFKTTYFYWVKNKKITPDIPGRNKSALDVSKLIGNPRGEGYTFLALTGLNSFSLINAKQYLSNTDVVLSVEYWTVDKTDQNIHSQWKMISNDSAVTLPSVIEKKLFDSLCGRDEAGRLVPDPTLPIKLKYGIENRPRQGMFVNRFEALKQYIEHANSIMLSEQIVSNCDISALKSYDPEPNMDKGLYDVVFDTDLELRFANIVNFVRASASPVISNGKIVGVTITNPGKGYLIAPYISIVGTGANAIVRSIVNNLGQITGTEIINGGSGYSDATVCLIRDYSALVHSDSQASNNWSIYSYDGYNQVWSRIITQAYDVRNFWTYADWYALGYSQFSAVDYSVSTLADLNSITVLIGQVVKVRTTNSGGWELLLKYNESTSVDWTLSYKVVGIQNGTIQFSSTLYEFVDTGIGYDGSTFDGSSFDIVAAVELRIILKTIKNKIFINTLKQEYLNLFFTAVRYTHSEQSYIDWIFKTSFIRAEHNVGTLNQPVTYTPDNLCNFEDYIAEVKPYRTKIREYISNYDNIDNGSLAVTDFDLQPVYENNQISLINTYVADGVIQASDPLIRSYPWKFWLDNVGYIVTELRIVSGGSGYVTEPTVVITSNSGKGATAKALYTNGVINRVILLTPGSGYLSAPTVTVNGGLSATGVPAVVVAVIGDSPVRSTLVKIKFDRLTQTYYINQLENTETFTGSGAKLQYKLQWAPDIRIGKSKVIINGVPVLRELYKFATVTSKTKGYTTYAGSITFTTPPAIGAVIEVSYIKNWDLLNAADRVQYYYNSSSGNLGKDLAQLMTGIDYGGVIVTGLGFDLSSGWDALPYFSDKWDSVDPTFDDYIVTASANQKVFTLPYNPPAGTQINVYHLQSHIDSYVSDGAKLEYIYSVLSELPVVTVVRTVSSATQSLLVNSAGLPTLTIASTVGLKIGDVVTCSSTAAFSYNTKITAIPSATTVSLSQIIFVDVPSASSIVFTRTLVSPIDVTINKNGSIILVNPIAAGSTIKISGSLAPVRIDDPAYSTLQQKNLDAVMYTPIVGSPGQTITPLDNGTASVVTPSQIYDAGQASTVYTSSDTTVDGEIINNSISNIIELPPEYSVLAGDRFIFRKSTSDGAIVPQNVDYDTAITGGTTAHDLSGAFTTATGFAADDIIMDGDGLVTPTSSPAPEEVVPGQIVDTLAIKVYDQFSSGSARFKVDRYFSDGVTSSYSISQQPNSPQAVVVKLGNVIETQVDNYTVDYRNKLIKFNTVPPAGQEIGIFSVGFNGNNILDIDYFVGDGVTQEFVTRATWLDTITTLVYIDGVVANAELFKTDSSYSFTNAVGIRFITPPVAGALINFVIVSGNQHTFSITKAERITPNGSSTSFILANPIGTSIPNESNIIVRVGSNILRAPTNSYFTIGGNRLNYTIDATKFRPYELTIDNIQVIADGKLLVLGNDYIVDIGGIAIKLSRPTYKFYAGKQLVVSVNVGADYSYNPLNNTITFNTAPALNSVVEVISSYQHNILDVERTTTTISSDLSITPDTLEFYTYTALSTGRIELDRPVIDDNYVWVMKNNTLLIPSSDYKVNDDKISIQLAAIPTDADNISVMLFSSRIITSSISYMQFKDMLNRVIYKRLSLNKQTSLVNDLLWNDTIITVKDASNFDIPNPSQNKPGIIEIRGERIEYFALTGNVLSRLRRGTLGTGTPEIHIIGSKVQDIGRSETIPYSDKLTVDQILSDGTNIVNLGFTPMTSVVATGKYTSTSEWTYATGYTSSIPVGYVQADDIEVFVGGYDSSLSWAAGVVYNVGTVVTVGSYTYRCITQHTSSSKFSTDSSNWTFFIGNIRLKKTPYKVHNVNIAPYSPEGDVQLDADFAVNGTLSSIRLTNKLAVGTQVTVVRRTGTAWDGSINILNDDGDISRFLKATPGVWYTDYNKYLQQTTTSNSTFDSTIGTFDATNTTFDQGN